MPKLLTKRKAKWANTFKPDMLRGDPLNPNTADAIRYYDDLSKLIDVMTLQTEREIKALYDTEYAEAYFAMDKSIAAQAKILTEALKKKFDNLFGEKAQPLAERMAKRADKSSSAALHTSIQKLSGGLSLSTKSLKGPLTEILKATIAENVSLIKSIPQQYLNGVQGAVMRSITNGSGLKDLVPYLAENKGITLRRARMIAHDQTRKAYNGLAKGRAQAIGVKEAEWLHSGGSNHPRKTHIAMSGKIFKLDEGMYDPAVKKNVFPGQEPNCRCRFNPVIKFGN